jgi:hypothetical protein
MDFSFVYNLQYSADTLAVENEFAQSMETGDYQLPLPLRISTYILTR